MENSDLPLIMQIFQKMSCLENYHRIVRNGRKNVKASHYLCSVAHYSSHYFGEHCSKHSGVNTNNFGRLIIRQKCNSCETKK